MKFKPGDRVRFSKVSPASEAEKKHYRHEMTVLGESSHPLAPLASAFNGGQYYDCRCDCDDITYGANEQCLEPIQKRPEPGSWQEIEKVTGWSPVRGPVTV